MQAVSTGEHNLLRRYYKVGMSSLKEDYSIKVWLLLIYSHIVFVYLSPAHMNTTLMDS